MVDVGETETSTIGDGNKELGIASIEEKESERNNSYDNCTTESTSTQTPKEEADMTAVSNDDADSDVQAATMDENSDDEEAVEAVGEISPIGTETTTSEVDVFPKQPDIDIDTDVAQSQRIEPEGATPVISKASQRFDNDVLKKVMSESQERQEIAEGTNQARMERIESEDAFAVQDDSVVNTDTNSQNTSKKKRQEPPGTPAKHERKKSETADEREQRIQSTIDEKDELEERRVHQIMHIEREVVEEKKGDDEISIQREPSGSVVSVNKSHRASWNVNNDQGNQPTNILLGSEKQEMSTNGEIKTERRYDSPSRIGQRHSLDYNLNHNIHAMANASNQPQTYSDSLRQNTLPLSPAFFVDDDESVPIPHLPSLMVPGMGPSYDSMSLQGQGQQIHLNHNGYHQQYHPRSSLLSQPQQQPVLPIPNQVTTMPGGKRKIHLHIWEDVSSVVKPETSSFLSFRKKGILRRSPYQNSSESEHDDRNHNRNGDNIGNDVNNSNWADRGTLTVSWYEGTSSLELQEHVQNSVIRKLGLRSTTTLRDFRVLDENSDSPEEIVLSPYIPNGSKLVIRFSTTDGGDLTPTKFLRFDDGPPDSPSAAPSPFPTSLDLNGLGLNANQLALLGTRLHSLQVPRAESLDSKSRGKLQPKSGRKSKKKEQEKKTIREGEDEDDTNSKESNFETNSKESNFEVASLHPEDPIQKSLREITGILLKERGGRQPYVPRQEKRQVVLVLANYFGLFLLLIAILAEIHGRAPDWHKAMEQQLKNVHDCSMDKESLLTCVENGDMAGLVASVILWVSRSAATKRIFLLGFGSSNKLWTAVYESLVTAICWGFSYMFIRRGMNPDNNRDFLRRYWKDAVYGSLAGFNAAFMKQVMKNLIPQEAIEDALQERQLKFLSWLPSIG
eukprot:CAMPEP_0116127340 /NCGR_PEP_ID=MMETSP0329-20121206/6791_1 /TAXON_ID=697910 /ORGANISM="Pseudo-nitzschia arenysensis, Strain B593" /LENGTH=902 /DNA_ID=CAMNT_0003621439 /DNA_START=36 /DNA_END=2744 /DNA_ORIENTATION=+